MKYKAGDKVRVRSDLEVGKCYKEFCFNNDMAKLRNRIVTIKSVRRGYYAITESDYNWTDDMFEGKVEDMDIEIEKMIDEKVEEFRKQLIEETKKLVEEQKEEVFPKVGDRYYYVCTYGIFASSCWENDTIDNERLALGNVFKTSEEAKFAVEKLKVIAELKKFAEPKDREWDAEANYHYFIYWDCTEARMIIGENCYLKHNEIYFESEEKALEAVKSVGEERIKKYYLEVEE